MLVQSVAMINFNKPHFTAAPRKEGAYYSPNDRVTIQDLYDSEDRIMEHQEKLIKNQSYQIAHTLNTMANYIITQDRGASSRFGRELQGLMNITEQYDITQVTESTKRSRRNTNKKVYIV